jgi:hypothetical protein
MSLPLGNNVELKASEARQWTVARQKPVISLTVEHLLFSCLSMISRLERIVRSFVP